MGRLNRRVRRLKDRTPSASLGHRRVLSEEERHERWLYRQRIRHRETTPKAAHHARDRLALFRLQGGLERIDSAETLIERVMVTTPAHEERSRPVTEAVILRAIYDREPGLEHLAEQVPDVWRAAFAASDTLAQRFVSMPPAVTAKWWIESRILREREASEAEINEHAATYERPYGITEELLTPALGPDADLLTDEERHWMVGESIADAMLGEWGWAIEKQIVEQEKKAKQTTGRRK
jgi:hypothetical protein